MEDLMTRFAERLDAEPWPPLPEDGAQIRKRGRRRRLERRIAQVGAAGAAAAVVVVVPVTVSTWHGTEGPSPAAAGIVQGSRPDEVTSVFGVSMTLPTDWDATEVTGTDGQLHACLGPTPVDTGHCPVTVSVAADPDQAFTNGIDPPFMIDTDCQPGDPNVITVVDLVVDGRQGHQWTGQCTPDSPLRQEWALDNRTFAVTSGDAAWDTEAQRLFTSARTPADWPHHDSEFTVATESPR